MDILVLALPGVYLLSHGIWLLKGKGKGWFFSTNIYAGAMCYAQIPGGLMFLCWSLGAIPQSYNLSSAIVYTGVGFGIVGLIFNFLQPSFLKPAWLKWLEHEHSDIMDLLFEEAHAMGLEIWEKRVETQAGLEEWVAEVRRKHGR